jgi:hypothetical protein
MHHGQVIRTWFCGGCDQWALWRSAGAAVPPDAPPGWGTAPDGTWRCAACRTGPPAAGQAPAAPAAYALGWHAAWWDRHQGQPPPLDRAAGRWWDGYRDSLDDAAQRPWPPA